MRLLSLAIVLVATLTGPALATTPEREPAARGDARLRTVRYSPAQIVTVRGRMGVQSMIEFRSDERVENVAVGDSAAWQVTPNRRAGALFVKPLMANARTNMTVITNRRTYLFDLVAGRAGGEPTYVLSFSYAEPPIVDPPATEAAAAAPTPAPAAPTAAEPPREARLALNFSWTVEGAGRLAPQQVFDDGHATYLRWAPGVSLPAILIGGAGGAEEPVNYSVVDDYVAVDGTPATLVLRAGTERTVLRRGAARSAAAAGARPIQTAER